MATYVIGDVQGCHETLMALLATVGFSAETDRLWLTGDLVNRGPASLAVLRFLKGLGPVVTTVLGNHDLHLLSRHAGIAGPKDLDTLDDVLRAPDRDALIAWLGERPLIHREGSLLLVHAGLSPTWTVEEAEEHARGMEAMLRDARLRRTLLARETYPPALKTLTTIRTCLDDGTLCKFNGAPGQAPAGCRPWFSHPARKSRGTKVIFGHWAALGLAEGSDWLGLDTACVWGGALTAWRLEDGRLFHEPARERHVRRAP